jgi:probable DNA metabolism protein
MLAHLSGPSDIAGFRAEAGQLLSHQVPPGEVQWEAETPQDPVHASKAHLLTPESNAPRAAAAIVPPSFQRLCELVVQHRDPGRFELLYRLLWRLVHEPGLRTDPLDADLTQAQHMAHAVRRDIHKAKSHLRFRTLQTPEGPLQVAWCEPAHHVIDTLALWHLKREPHSRWAILSPDRCACADGDELVITRGLEHGPAPDADDDAWLAAWRQALLVTA